MAAGRVAAMCTPEGVSRPGHGPQWGRWAAWWVCSAWLCVYCAYPVPPGEGEPYVRQRELQQRGTEQGREQERCGWWAGVGGETQVDLHGVCWCTGGWGRTSVWLRGRGRAVTDSPNVSVHVSCRGEALCDTTVSVETYLRDG